MFQNQIIKICDINNSIAIGGKSFLDHLRNLNCLFVSLNSRHINRLSLQQGNKRVIPSLIVSNLLWGGFLAIWLSTTTKINLNALNSSTILEIVVNTIKNGVHSVYTNVFSGKEVVKKFVTMELNHENIPTPLKPKKMKLPQEL